MLTDKKTIIPLWAKLLQAILSRRRRDLYSFKEEVALFKSVVIFNFAWSTFTLLASQVGRKHTQRIQIAKTRSAKNIWRDQNFSFQSSFHLPSPSTASTWYSSATRFLLIYRAHCWWYNFRFWNNPKNIQDLFQGLILPLCVLFEGTRSPYFRINCRSH